MTMTFCEFVIGSDIFVIIEPFGDNTVYWIVAKEPPASPEALSSLRNTLLDAPPIPLL
jgi:hypothetical protein